jgi:hypothetical protein
VRLVSPDRSLLYSYCTQDKAQRPTRILYGRCVPRSNPFSNATGLQTRRTGRAYHR